MQLGVPTAIYGLTQGHPFILFSTDLKRLEYRVVAGNVALYVCVCVGGIITHNKVYVCVLLRRADGRLGYNINHI